MKRLQPLLLSLLLGCSHKEYHAQQCKALAAPKAFLERCMGGKINGNYVGDVKCWPFSPPQRFHGVLLSAFETQEFYPNARTPGEAAKASPKIWVELELTGPLPTALGGPPDGLTHRFSVDVDGRLSLCDGWFGHLGQYPRELLITHFYSVRPLSNSSAYNYKGRPETVRMR